jgi:lipopolysaccharide export system permease protein
MEFAEHGIPYRLPGVEDGTPEPRAMPTLDLMMSSVPEEIAEWHFRIGVPMATLILAILAVPLSRSQPRQGRYGKLAIGLLVFIIYFNLMSAGKAWLEQGTVSPMVGIWWVHALMLSIALILLSMQNGVHRRLFAARRRV